MPGVSGVADLATLLLETPLTDVRCLPAGPVLLTCEDGTTVLIAMAEGGERITVSAGPWPAGPGGEVAGEEPYTDLLGVKADFVLPSRTGSGAFSGVELIYPGAKLVVQVTEGAMAVTAAKRHRPPPRP